MRISKDIAFSKPLRGDFVGRGQWKLTAPFEYSNPPIKIVAPIGFITDGASIPRIAWILIGSPWGGKYAKAAVIHDYGYLVRTMTREQVDKIFIEGMEILGVSWWKKRLMYRMVRMFAWICWNKRK